MKQKLKEIGERLGIALVAVLGVFIVLPLYLLAGVIAMCLSPFYWIFTGKDLMTELDLS